MKNKKIFSFDAETNGLWGKAFSIGAIVVGEDKQQTHTFVARCPILGEVNSYVSANVLPQMESIEITHMRYEEMLLSFIDFYREHKKDSDIIVHMGMPVEARLFRDAHYYGFIGDYDAPYPLIDISAYPEINTSVDTYCKDNNIVIPECQGGTHNPLYDSWAALLAYKHIKG